MMPAGVEAEALRLRALGRRPARITARTRVGWVRAAVPDGPAVADGVATVTLAVGEAEPLAAVGVADVESTDRSGDDVDCGAQPMVVSAIHAAGRRPIAR
jgi:hypothetical protein